MLRVVCKKMCREWIWGFPLAGLDWLTIDERTGSVVCFLFISGRNSIDRTIRTSQTSIDLYQEVSQMKCFLMD